MSSHEYLLISYIRRPYDQWTEGGQQFRRDGMVIRSTKRSLTAWDPGPDVPPPDARPAPSRPRLFLALLIGWAIFLACLATADGAPARIAKEPAVRPDFGDGPVPFPLVKDPIYMERRIAFREALTDWLGAVRVERVAGGLRYVDCYDGASASVEALAPYGADLGSAYLVPLRAPFEAALARTPGAESWSNAELSAALREFVLAAFESDGPFVPASLTTTCTSLPCCGDGADQCGSCLTHRCDCGTCGAGRACRCERGGANGTCSPPASMCNIDDPATLRLKAVGVDGAE